MNKKITLLFSCLLVSLTSQLAAQQTSTPPASLCQPYVVPVPAETSDTTPVKTEFFISAASDDLRQNLAEHLKKTAINKVFPDAYWYRRTFETGTVAYLYERVILQTDLQALSRLLTLMQSEDHQLSSDAMAAIAFLHFQLNTPDNIKRGTELIKTAFKGSDSYPAGAFWGRALALGGPYADQQLKTAMGYLTLVGNLPGQRISDGKSFDKLNDLHVHTKTIMHLFVNVPEMPARQAYEAIYTQAMGMMKAQEDYTALYIKSAYYEKAEKNLHEQFNAILQSQKIKDLQIPEADTRTVELPLNTLLSRQELLAQKITSLKKPDEHYLLLITQLSEKNQALQKTLYEQQTMLFNELINSKENFPKNVAPLPALMQTQAALSRSCSLEQTWNHIKNKKP